MCVRCRTVCCLFSRRLPSAALPDAGGGLPAAQLAVHLQWGPCAVRDGNPFFAVVGEREGRALGGDSEEAKHPTETYSGF